MTLTRVGESEFNTFWIGTESDFEILKNKIPKKNGDMFEDVENKLLYVYMDGEWYSNE